MADKKIVTNTNSIGYKGVTLKSETKTETSMFPYGCQWGCGRQNVVSKPGNSCGRPACNDARSAKSWGKGNFGTYASNKK